MAYASGHVYDVLVVGAGLSGSEAAIACARGGLDVLLLTTSLDTLYLLAADGAVLEPSPGTLMRELAPALADARGYVDSWALHRAAKYALEHTPGLHLLQSSASALYTVQSRVTGVATWEGVPRSARITALCVGSFLFARLRVGELTEKAGRLSEMAYDELYEDLRARGFIFVPQRFQGQEVQGGLAYTVDCQVLAPEERAEGFALRRLHNLYAAGVCAAGELSYEQSAEQGRLLGEALLARLGSSPD